MESLWQIRTDTGGTFTDAFARAPDGGYRRLKILSSGVLRAILAEEAKDTCRIRVSGLPPAGDGFFRGFSLRPLPGGVPIRVIGWSAKDPQTGEMELESPIRAPRGTTVELATGEEAPVVASRILTGTPPGREFPPLDFRLATTRATNALLERKIAPVVLFLNEGFEDLLLIGDQRRPDLFALGPTPSPPLFAASIGISGRLDASGRELEPLDLRILEERAAEAAARFPGATAAVALLHAHRNPVHEIAVERVLRRAGFPFVARSSALAASIKLLPRAQTSLVEAALAPVVRSFLDGVARPTGQKRLWMMNSAGGLLPAEGFAAKDALLSGPAAGAVGAATMARGLGWDKVLTFDMGGTSTDVARMDGRFAYQFEHQVGDARLIFPSIKIETVAAGGGSICRWADGRLQVGPESAGADPGPACYGKGGPLTVTDLNLLLGYFQTEGAPVPIHRTPARQRLEELAAEVTRATGEEVAPLQLAADLRRLAIEIMADAIRTVSLREGANPSDYALLAFGGAGPQHACEIADALQITRVAVPADAGLLSARGLHHAPVERIAESLEINRLDAILPQLAEKFSFLRKQALEAVRNDTGNDTEVIIEREFLTLRLVGQDSTIAIEWNENQSIDDAFSAEYVKLFHSPPPPRPREVVSLRVVASSVVPPPNRECLPVEAISGPGLLQDGFSTCVIPAGWTYRRGSEGTLVLERTHLETAAFETSAAVRTELFRARFGALVSDMGALLERTALSANIRERLDFSCALLDPDGYLVVNAPHIPVHLGALGICVRSVARHLELKPGDVVITNHPAHGGSHLPDVTVLAPVFADDGSRLGYVANRAHHAEIGGLSPGSMPPDARCLAEEGVVIPPTFLARENCPPDWDAVRKIFEAGRWPSRNPEENLADLLGQWTSLIHARAGLENLARQHGAMVLLDAMQRIAEQAGNALDAALSHLHLPEKISAEECLDDGTPIRVEIRQLPGGKLEIDTTTSSPQHPGNFNASPAITTSCVLYVTRLLAGGNLPLNDGLLRSIVLKIKEGTILSPFFTESAETCPAVVAGNVETSQHLVNALLRALGVAASSQGTMNNVLFGNEIFAHYETLGGGHGAVPGIPGLSGRHSHMTNTAITDPEILEHRFPVRLRRFSLRPGSGGAGRWPGGSGLVREYEFLAPLRVSLLGSKRLSGPRGAAGGQAGSPGRNEFRRAGGQWEAVGGIVSLDVGPGDCLRVSTPGGGGWGET